MSETEAAVVRKKPLAPRVTLTNWHVSYGAMNNQPPPVAWSYRAARSNHGVGSGQRESSKDRRRRIAASASPAKRSASFPMSRVRGQDRKIASSGIDDQRSKSNTPEQAKDMTVATVPYARAPRIRRSPCPVAANTRASHRPGPPVSSRLRPFPLHPSNVAAHWPRCGHPNQRPRLLPDCSAFFRRAGTSALA